jgi:uncharacterized protein (TIGR03118 family)
MRTWLRRLRGVPVVRTAARRPRPCRLGVECLEDRRLLSGNVLQTNLVSDLPGAAQHLDPNLVNPWGIAQGPTPLWISDNNAGVSTLYDGQGVAQPAPPKAPLVVSIPTPPDPLGASGAPTGTVFNIDAGGGGFKVSGVDATGKAASAPAFFLFATEDGTIVGWNPGVNPPNFVNPGTYGIIAVNNSGNNFTEPDPAKQTGAVYKGMSIASSSSAIFSSDPASTTVLYVTNFRAGMVEAYDPNFKPITLTGGAFTDTNLPKGYAPFNIQVLGGKVYVTYALQNDTKHDDVAGPHHGFVDVYNLDGTGGTRLISGGALDSPWGLAFAPAGFAGITAPPNGDPILLVGNFGNGRINAFDGTTGTPLGQLKDPDGEPIQIDGLWGLKFGNGSAGTSTSTLYFTAGIFGEKHGLFGSLTTAAPGSAEGQAEAQLVTAFVDVVMIDLSNLKSDLASGASAATIKQDLQTLKSALVALVHAEAQFAHDVRTDLGIAGHKGDHDDQGDFDG